jgi:recombination protein RecT
MIKKELVQKFDSQLKGYLQTINDLLVEQDINPQQFMIMASNQVKRSDRLIDIFSKNPASVFSSILTCAELGLSPTSQMGEAWLIPYGKECQFQIGYQGLVKILYRNKYIQNITSECVYENDEFDYSLGLNPTLNHKPAVKDRGVLINVYCVVRMKGQEPIFKVMSVSELQEYQQLSKAGSQTVWFSKNDPQHWMLKKTVFKQLCKLLPRSLNMTKAVSYDNIIEAGGVMRIDEDGQHTATSPERITKASRFEDAMEIETTTTGEVIPELFAETDNSSGNANE